VSGSTNWTDALQNWSKWKVRRMKQTMVHWVKLASSEIWRCSSRRGTCNIVNWIRFVTKS
jgi:hypothetical protein